MKSLGWQHCEMFRGRLASVRLIRVWRFSRALISLSPPLGSENAGSREEVEPLGEQDGCHRCSSRALFSSRGRSQCGDGTVKKNQPQTGLTRVTCPGLNKSLKPETKMLSALRISSHVPPLELRMGSAHSLLFPVTILNLPGLFRPSNTVLLSSQHCTSVSQSS